ncbi:MAG TPA: type II secretion system protein GspK [Candidatus Omnitrophota bacterium]|nr:type II secretion system protein GspK [Candidatus Omnitrophota bacterium]HPD85147.1 type II secretion system protein GspK [Candidatus Omnitrophota bacterium]HRZ04352.1 type II secretion system protein GspK [Candidatus Omnitrophota bacterium]
MAKASRLSARSGTVLVLALWALGLLTVFALNLGAGIRQKIILISRLEQREKIHDVAEAGVKKAIAVLNSTYVGDSPVYSVERKIKWHDNGYQFGHIEIGNGVCEVSYDSVDGAGWHRQKYYGIVDEERKININKTDATTLENLFKLVLGRDARVARDLALAIINWREYGESELTGFYSDEYYSNLQYPYQPKNADFEVLDELLLVRGINEDILEKILPYVTIYGEGKANVNTAPREVLIAVGLSDELADKIISVRRGPDKIEATKDDFIFQQPYDIATNLRGLTKLSENEVNQINQLNAAGKIGTDSQFFSIKSTGSFSGKNGSNQIACVFNVRNHEVEYYRERY